MPLPNVEYYRKEAASLRQAAEVIRDQGFREQLLSIADDYEAAAIKIETQIDPRGRPFPRPEMVRDAAD